MDEVTTIRRQVYTVVDTIEPHGPELRPVVHAPVRFGRRSIDYRHYLPVLAKPQVAEELMPRLDAHFHLVASLLAGRRFTEGYRVD